MQMKGNTTLQGEITAKELKYTEDFYTPRNKVVCVCVCVWGGVKLESGCRRNGFWALDSYHLPSRVTISHIPIGGRCSPLIWWSKGQVHWPSK
jgi:hypothetical protein